MNLQNLKKLFADNGCQYIYVKTLSANDNSKNQVYLGGNFEILNILPISTIRAEEAGKWEKERFKASLTFAWISEDGQIFPAPHAQLILYPKYPEVRFSGFLLKCEKPPSELMTQRLPGRLLLIGVTKVNTILGYVSAPDSDVAQEIKFHSISGRIGIFDVIELSDNVCNKNKLLLELSRIHKLGWIESKRLDRNGYIMPCSAPNCGGYTLEAELGITPNGYSEPDYLGWEIKQFRVANFNRISSSVITLMTPEPTDGIYKTQGTEAFIRKFGYTDKTGRVDRINFGGIHKTGRIHPTTNLELRVIGYDATTKKISKVNGRIALMDLNDIEAASWSFTSLMEHWNRKHNQACYIPSISSNSPVKRYKFGNQVILGSGTDFHFFLHQIALGKIYYDPGIKMENASSRPKIKRRSQFRVSSKDLGSLYINSELISILNR